MGILECGTPLLGVVLSSTNPRGFAGTDENNKFFKRPQADDNAATGNYLREDTR
jgi:hypothetical protein